MFSKIKSFFVTAEQTVVHDVEAIITNFTTTVEKLEAAAVAKVKEADAHYAASVVAENAGNAARAAANKAQAVAEKIKALVA